MAIRDTKSVVRIFDIFPVFFSFVAVCYYLDVDLLVSLCIKM